MTVNNRCLPSSALIPSPCCKARLTAKSRYGPQRQWSPDEDEATVSTTASSSSPVQLFLEALLSTVGKPSSANMIEPCDGLKRQHSAESDCDSVTSTSSSNSSGSASRRPPLKKRQKHGARVRFADVLITSIFTRPRTSQEDKSLLHYSFDEMDQFREEYYLERGRQQQAVVLQDMVLASPSSDSSAVSNLEISHVIIEEDEEAEPQEERRVLSVRKHPVSRVVIHKDDVQPSNVKDEDQEGSSSPGYRAVYIANDCDDYSFDNPAFWNGNLTWY